MSEKETESRKKSDVTAKNMVVRFPVEYWTQPSVKDSRVMGQLVQGKVVEVLEEGCGKNNDWIKIKNPDDQRGTPVYVFQDYLKQVSKSVKNLCDRVEMVPGARVIEASRCRISPDRTRNDNVIRQVLTGSSVKILDATCGNGNEWAKVELPDGVVGYLPRAVLQEKSLRPQKIEHSRNKIELQEMGIAQFLYFVRTTLEAKPETPRSEFMKWIEERKKVFSSNQIKAMEEGIEELYKKRDIINKYYEQYKNDPNALVKKIIGGNFKVYDPVELRRGVASLDFIIEDDWTWEQIKKAIFACSAAVGMFLYDVKISELNETCTFAKKKEGGSKMTAFEKNTIIHEGQHAINNLVLDKVLREKYGQPTKQQKIWEENVKGEILAHLTPGGWSEEKTIKHLVGINRYYDHFFGKLCRDGYREYDARKKQQHRQYSAWRRYSREIKNFVKIATEMKKRYPDMYLEILSVKPIREWNKLKRIYLRDEVKEKFPETTGFLSWLKNNLSGWKKTDTLLFWGKAHDLLNRLENFDYDQIKILEILDVKNFDPKNPPASLSKTKDTRGILETIKPIFEDLRTLSDENSNASVMMRRLSTWGKSFLKEFRERYQRMMAELSAAQKTTTL